MSEIPHIPDFENYLLLYIFAMKLSMSDINIYDINIYDINIIVGFIFSGYFAVSHKIKKNSKAVHFY